MDQNASPVEATVVTGTISFNQQTNTAYWSGQNPVYLYQGDELEITFSGFPASSTLEQVVVTPARYLNQPQSWTPGSNKILDKTFSFSLPADNIYNPLYMYDYYFGVTSATYYLSANGWVGGSNKTWKIDPEVINHAGTQIPGGEETGDGAKP